MQTKQYKFTLRIHRQHTVTASVQLNFVHRIVHVIQAKIKSNQFSILDLSKCNWIPSKKTVFVWSENTAHSVYAFQFVVYTRVRVNGAFAKSNSIKGQYVVNERDPLKLNSQTFVNCVMNKKKNIGKVIYHFYGCPVWLNCICRIVKFDKKSRSKTLADRLATIYTTSYVGIYERNWWFLKWTARCVGKYFCCFFAWHISGFPIDFRCHQCAMQNCTFGEKVKMSLCGICLSAYQRFDVAQTLWNGCQCVWL